MRWWALERGDQLAISVSGESLTYAELHDWVGKVARHLADSGFAVGDRLGLYGETSLEWCIASLAAIRCGGISAGLNSRMVAAEVGYLLGRYAPTALFADPEGLGRLEAGGILAELGKVTMLDPATVAALRGAAPADVRRDIDPDAPVAIITTSGSTARPKGVTYSHRTMIDYGTYEAIANWHDLAGGDISRVLTTAPLSTAGGFNLMISSIAVGGQVFLQAKFDPGEALALIARFGINTFRANPLFFERMAQHPDFAGTDLSTLRIATAGGSAVADWLIDAWAERGVILRQLYGQTEVGGTATINPIRYAKSDPDRCGYGNPFTEIAIIDEDGNFLGPNQSGQIVCRGAGIMLGYWNDPEATAQALVDGWLRTGDIGTIDERGLLKMTDRLKDIIRSGGLTISSAELERTILELPEVEEVAVIAIPDAKFGEAPMAIVYGNDPSAEAIVAHCRTQLSSYKVPKRIEIRDEPMPRLAMGKIAKPALRAHYLAPAPATAG